MTLQIRSDSFNPLMFVNVLVVNLFMNLSTSIAAIHLIRMNGAMPVWYIMYNADAHEVKKTTRKPIQLPTTPIAEYELVNINGKNSYFAPNTS